MLTVSHDVSAVLPSQVSAADSNAACLPGDKLINSSIRMPRGIPPPPPSQPGIPQTTATSGDSVDDDTCDTNPLRRLRNVSSFRPVTTCGPRYQ